jgi:hypothetical protein
MNSNINMNAKGCVYFSKNKLEASGGHVGLVKTKNGGIMSESSGSTYIEHT